jgi:hypothetical protein
MSTEAGLAKILAKQPPIPTGGEPAPPHGGLPVNGSRGPAGVLQGDNGEYWLGSTAAGEYLGVSRDTIRRWSKLWPKRLPKYQVLEGMPRYRKSDLDRFRDTFMRPRLVKPEKVAVTA